MTDEERLRQTLQNVQNDAVVVSRMLMRYETEAEFMSVLGAVFDTWCDGHGVPTDERRRILQQFVAVFNKTRKDEDK
ncbi:MAG: hypothetical protein IKS76_03860 [Paludibacteraceae bacterium]|nr:hypothetical protein [Paludibacteraceae bacterium]